VVTVTDNGPGIPQEFQSRIFSRFARADAARSGSEGTSGLGLSIVESIVQAHGGSVEVTSRPGRTEFALRLPTATTERL
jgi:two-component system OmpR family sensor kinase